MPGWNGTLAQRFSVRFGVFTVVIGVIGLIVNPDFGTGSEVTSEWFLIDWNGWHAVSALLLGITAIVVAARPLWAMVFLPANAVGNVIESGWALFDTTPLGVLAFPNVATDLALHFAIAAASMVVFFIQRARNRVATTAYPAGRDR